VGERKYHLEEVVEVISFSHCEQGRSKRARLRCPAPPYVGAHRWQGSRWPCQPLCGTSALPDLARSLPVRPPILCGDRASKRSGHKIIELAPARPARRTLLASDQRSTRGGFRRPRLRCVRVRPSVPAQTVRYCTSTVLNPPGHSYRALIFVTSALPCG